MVLVMNTGTLSSPEGSIVKFYSTSAFFCEKNLCFECLGVHPFFSIYKSSVPLITLAGSLHRSSAMINYHVHVYFAVLFSERRLNSITDERGI
jgi:hypothetical protein